MAKEKKKKNKKQIVDAGEHIVKQEQKKVLPQEKPAIKIESPVVVEAPIIKKEAEIVQKEEVKKPLPKVQPKPKAAPAKHDFVFEAPKEEEKKFEEVEYKYARKIAGKEEPPKTQT